MPTTPEDAERDEMVQKIIAEHKDAIREEIEDELRDELRDELLWDDDFVAEALELNGEDRVVWVKVTDDSIQAQISEVVGALKNLLTAMRGDNQPPGQASLLHEFERQQLVAVLEVALVELKAPYLDRGRFRGIKGWLGTTLRKAIDQQASQAIRDALSGAVNKTKDLVSSLDDSDHTTFF